MKEVLYQLSYITLVRAEGIEPSTKRWQRLILPLNYARITGCPGRDRTYDTVINSHLLLPTELLDNITCWRHRYHL